MPRSSCCKGGQPNGTVALKTLAEETGGELIGASVPLSMLALDSRHVGKGDLFAAIKGSQVDGHDYVVEALSPGAAALPKTKLEGIAPQLVVSALRRPPGDLDTLPSFWRRHRRHYRQCRQNHDEKSAGSCLEASGAVHATSVTRITNWGSRLRSWG